MNRFALLLSVSLILVITCVLYAGCAGKDDQESLGCPFTELGWDATVDDMTTLEGSDYATYDSVYDGTTYTYSKSYLDTDGTIKYMFDDKDKLMCVAWNAGIDSENTLKSLYTKIHDQIVEKHGKSGHDAENATNYGDVWYLDSGDIVLSAVTTSDPMGLQYSYLNPQVSNTESKK